MTWKNPKYYTRKVLNTFRKVPGFKSTHKTQSPFYILIMNLKRKKLEGKKILFTTALKENKTKSIKQGKRPILYNGDRQKSIPYNENFQTLKKTKQKIENSHKGDLQIQHIPEQNSKNILPELRQKGSKTYMTAYITPRKKG